MSQHQGARRACHSRAPVDVAARRAVVAPGPRGQRDEALGVEAQRQRQVVRQRLAQGIEPGDAGRLGAGGW